MKNRIAYLLAAGAAVLAFCSADSSAQTLYKLIDKNGKVTYSEKPPKDFDGKVVPMNIDPNANTATLPKPGASSPQPDPRFSSPASGGGGSQVQSARDRLDAAKKALQNAIDNPGEGDVQRIGNKGGFTRPVPTEEYQKKIAALEADVKKAEEELRVAEGR
jgi:hypothetical protein